MAKRSPVLIESMMMQFFVFATFNSFWRVIVLHLTAEPYGWSVLQAGLFGFVGIAAAVVTPVFGRLIDRFGPLPVIGVSLGVLLIACLSAVFDAYLVGLFAGTLFLVTLANQSVQAANQSRVLVANPDNAAQANTLFMVGVFMGGSTGAIVGPVAYSMGAMPAVAVATCFLVIAGLIGWAVACTQQKRRDRRRVACDQQVVACRS